MSTIQPLRGLWGGYVRRYHKGQWATSIFDGLDMDTIKTALLAVANNRDTGLTADATTPVKSFKGKGTGDSLAKRKYDHRVETMLKASEKILKVPNVISNQIDYAEVKKSRFFVKTNMDSVLDDVSFTTFNVVPMIKSNNKVVNIYKNFAYSGNGMDGLKIDDDFLQHTLGMFSNPFFDMKKLQPGDYEVILDPETSGFLIHEVLGHLLEGDLVYNHPAYLEEKIKIGRQVSIEEFTVIDDPTLENMAGSYLYDDEGNPGKKVLLIEKGRIYEFLHSMDTAKQLKQSNNGHARSIEYHLPPYVRMSNTYIQSGDASFDDVVSNTKKGVYLKNCMFAKSDMERFQVFPKEAYLVENGKIIYPVTPPVAYGNIFDVLKNIEIIGNDLQFYNVACTKGYSNAWIPVTVGGVHLKVSKMTLGESIL